MHAAMQLAKYTCWGSCNFFICAVAISKLHYNTQGVAPISRELLRIQPLLPQHIQIWALHYISWATFVARAPNLRLRCTIGLVQIQLARFTLASITSIGLASTSPEHCGFRAFRRKPLHARSRP